MSTTDHHLPQNVYDDPSFFEGYKCLRQGDTGLNGVLEVPAIHALLPELQGQRVLDLGCGFGDGRSTDTTMRRSSTRRGLLMEY